MLLPLCLQDFQGLAFASLLGTIGTFGTGAFIIGRFADGSYEPGGAFFEVARWKPSFCDSGAGSVASSGGILVFVSK